MDRLVSTDWLAQRLGDGNLRILDASQHLPGAGRDAAAEFAEAHIPGARFLDLASFIDESSPVPKALPRADQFAGRMGKMGVEPGSRVVLYDDSAIRSAARAFFIFRHFGFEQVAILDGGFARWRAEGRPVEHGSVPDAEGHFPVPESSGDVRGKAEMLANCASRSEQVVDARDAARFAGEDGSGSEGHIPGARSLPFTRLFEDDGTYKDAAEIRAEFVDAGIDPDRPVVASCNSGVTAAVLLFGLEVAGKPGGALYDGSWMEWGGDPDTPKEKGAAR